MEGKRTNKATNKAKDYLTATSTTAIRKIDGKEYIVQSYFLGGKDINEVLMRLAVDKIFEDMKKDKKADTNTQCARQALEKKEAI